MLRALILALLMLCPVVTAPLAAPSKCETAMTTVMECHQACQDSHFDAPGLKQCEDKCPSTPKGCADGTDKVPAK
jgi:hypothetical protein